MKAYKVEVLVLDFEGYGAEQIALMIDNARGLNGGVQKIYEAEIGEWDDDHPLNKRATQEAEYLRLFPVASEAIAPMKQITGD